MSIKRIKDFPEGSGSLTSDDIFIFMDDPAVSGITKKIDLNQITTSMKAVVSKTNGITGAASISNIVKISQANYDTLGSYDSNTVYIIT